MFWRIQKSMIIIRWTGHVARVGKRRGVYRILVGKPEGKRQLVRPRPRWKDNKCQRMLNIYILIPSY
jgi:hypothetical protein